LVASTLLPVATAAILVLLVVMPASPQTGRKLAVGGVSATVRWSGSRGILGVSVELSSGPAVVEVYDPGGSLLGRAESMDGGRVFIPIAPVASAPQTLAVRVVAYVAGEKKLDALYRFSARLEVKSVDAGIWPEPGGLRIGYVSVALANRGDLPAALPPRSVEVSVDGNSTRIPSDLAVIGPGEELGLNATLGNTIPPQGLWSNHTLRVSTPAGARTFAVPPLNATASVLDVTKADAGFEVAVEVTNCWKYPIDPGWLEVVCDGSRYPATPKNQPGAVQPGARGVIVLSVKAGSCTRAEVSIGGRVLSAP